MPFAAGQAGFPVGALGDEELAAVGGTITERGLLLGSSCCAVDAGDPVDSASLGFDVTAAVPPVLAVTTSEIVDIVICTEFVLDAAITGFELVIP